MSWTSDQFKEWINEREFFWHYDLDGEPHSLCTEIVRVEVRKLIEELTLLRKVDAAANDIISDLILPDLKEACDDVDEWRTKKGDVDGST